MTEPLSPTMERDPMNARIWDNEINGVVDVPCNDAQAVAKAQLELMDRIAAAIERLIAHMPA